MFWVSGLTTIVDVVEVKIGASEKPFYGVFVGWGNIAICDAWILEESDVELLVGKEAYKELWDSNVYGVAGEFSGVFLTREKEKAEKIAQLIRERHPEGFCLGCLRNEHKRK